MEEKQSILMEIDGVCGSYRIIRQNDYDEDVVYCIDMKETNYMGEEVWVATGSDDWSAYEDVIDYLVKNYVLQQPQEPQVTPEV